MMMNKLWARTFVSFSILFQTFDLVCADTITTAPPVPQATDSCILSLIVTTHFGILAECPGHNVWVLETWCPSCPRSLRKYDPLMADKKKDRPVDRIELGVHAWEELERAEQTTQELHKTAMRSKTMNELENFGTFYLDLVTQLGLHTITPEQKMQIIKDLRTFLEISNPGHLTDEQIELVCQSVETFQGDMLSDSRRDEQTENHNQNNRNILRSNSINKNHMLDSNNNAKGSLRGGASAAEDQFVPLN